MPEGLGFDLFLIFSDTYELFVSLNPCGFKDAVFLNPIKLMEW